MLLYQDGRFHVGNASFVLPGKCYLETRNAEGQWGKGLEIVDIERKYRIVVRGFNDKWRNGDLFQFLHEENPPFRLLSPIIPINHNGLAGYYVYYEDARHSYCEYLFDLATGDEVNGLHVLVSMQKMNGNIFDVVQGQMVQTLLAGIRRESEE